jgi:hypothetical protein
MSEAFDWNHPSDLFAEASEMSFDDFEREVLTIAQKTNAGVSIDSDELFAHYFEGMTPEEALHAIARSAGVL